MFALKYAKAEVKGYLSNIKTCKTRHMLVVGSTFLDQRDALSPALN